MKVKDLIEKIGASDILLQIDGETVTERHFDLNIKKIFIHTAKETMENKDNLESLGYSFEVGV
ncbi:hypothetical protein [Natronospora cellulosivora (SeqCode)]